MTATAPATAGPRTSARRERTRERLLDAALDLFAEHGVEATSIEAICEGADFTRGAFYSNFEDKADLVDALTSREQVRAVRQLREAIQNGPWATDEQCDASDLDAIGRIVTTLLRAITLDPRWGVINSELRLMAMRDPRLAPSYLAREEALLGAIGEEVGRLLAQLEVELLIPDLVFIRLVVAGFQSELERADLEAAGRPSRPAGRDPFAAAAEAASQWLPVVVEQLTRQRT